MLGRASQKIIGGGRDFNSFGGEIGGEGAF